MYISVLAHVKSPNKEDQVMPFLKVDPESVVESESKFSIRDELDLPELSDKEYKEKLLGNFKHCINASNSTIQVDTYYDYKSRITLKPKGTSKFPPSFMLLSFLMTSFNLGMTKAKKVATSINACNKRAFDRSIIYREGHIDLNKVPINARHLFENTTVVSDKYMTVEACVIQESVILQELHRFLSIVNNLAAKDYAKNKSFPRYKPLINIPVNELLSMSVTSRLKFLANTVNITRDVANVALNIKKDIGNLGREYHLIANTPRPDRAKISSFYGYDFESALQVIVLQILKEINPKFLKTNNVTNTFVMNKVSVRQYVVDTLGVDMEMAKKIITAAYQGAGLNSISTMVGFGISKEQREGMEGLYTETKQIILELLKISSSTFIVPSSVLGSHFVAAKWYAAHRTSVKHDLVNPFDYTYYEGYIAKYTEAKAFKFAKSYMFYLWTYFEGEARKIVASHLKQAISLHDAVYTQDKASFDQLNVQTVEDEILYKIGIPLKLGEA